MTIGLEEAQKNTVIGMINDIFMSGEFLSSQEGEVEEGETVLGVMTQYEKAIASARIKVARDNNEMVKEAEKNNAPVDVKLVTRNKQDYEALTKLLWTSLERRLDPESNYHRLTLRSDWRVVGSKDGASEDIDILFKLIVGDLLDGLGEESDSEKKRDCGTCEAYDICPLPFKKTL